MMARTHIVSGMLAGAASAAALPGAIPVIVIGSATLGSILPDVDEPGSKAGRYLPGLSHLLKLCLGHRGLTHSLLVPTGALIVLFLVAGLTQVGMAFLQAGGALVLGYGVHILGDACTGRVPLVSPISRRKYGIHLFRTDSLTEHIFAFPILSLAAFYLTLTMA